MIQFFQLIVLIKAFLLWMIPSWITPNHITLFSHACNAVYGAFLYDKHYAFGIPLFVFVAFYRRG